MGDERHPSDAALARVAPRPLGDAGPEPVTLGPVDAVTSTHLGVDTRAMATSGLMLRLTPWLGEARKVHRARGLRRRAR